MTLFWLVLLVLGITLGVLNLAIVLISVVRGGRNSPLLAGFIGVAAALVAIVVAAANLWGTK